MERRFAAEAPPCYIVRQRPSHAGRPRNAMCGISGFNFPDGPLIGSMNRCLAHRGPDHGDVLRGRRGEPRPPAAQHHRPLGGLAPADGGRVLRGLAHLQRRGLQLPRAARLAREGGRASSARRATARCCCTPTAAAASPSCASSTACSRSALRPRRADGCSWPATPTGSSRSTTTGTASASPSPPRSRPCSSIRCRASSTRARSPSS